MDVLGLHHWSKSRKQQCIQSLTKLWLEGSCVYAPILWLLCPRTNTGKTGPGTNVMPVHTLGPSSSKVFHLRWIKRGTVLLQPWTGCYILCLLLFIWTVGCSACGVGVWLETWFQPLTCIPCPPASLKLKICLCSSFSLFNAEPEELILCTAKLE